MRVLTHSSDVERLSTCTVVWFSGRSSPLRRASSSMDALSSLLAPSAAEH